MKQHKWHKEIKAWADGAEIQCRWLRLGNKDWQDCPQPAWLTEPKYEYRIKPEIKPDYVLYGNIPNVTLMDTVKDFKSNEVWYKMNSSLTPFKTNADRIKFVFDGETGELKSASIIK